MEIISASSERVITDVGMTYLAYTFSKNYQRFNQLQKNHNKLKTFSQNCDSIPTIYDIQFQEKAEDEFISITGQKPEYTPLSTGQLDKLSKQECKSLINQVCTVLIHSEEQGIFHLDIGFHTISYDSNLDEVYIFDWYDSVLSVPATPPFYISEYYPPQLSSDKTYTQVELQQAESYQLCCFIDDLLQINGFETPQVIKYGRSRTDTEYPTIETIKNTISNL